MPFDLNKPPLPNLNKPPLPTTPRDGLPRLPLLPLPQYEEMNEQLEPAGGNFRPEYLLADIIDNAVQLSNDILNLLTGEDTTIYTNPSGTVELDNCELYPNSPLCTNNPFDVFGFGTDVEVTYNGCEVCVKITIGIGVRLPPLIYCRRSNDPNCEPNLEPETPQPQPNPGDPPPPIPFSPIDFNPYQNWEDGFGYRWIHPDGRIQPTYGSSPDSEFAQWHEHEGEIYTAKDAALLKLIEPMSGYFMSNFVNINHPVYQGIIVQVEETWFNQIGLYFVYSFLSGYSVGESIYRRQIRRYFTANSYEVLEEYVGITTFTIKVFEPRFLPTLPQEPTMPQDCCRELNDKLDKIIRVLGVNRFPIKAPKRLIEPRKRGEVTLKDFTDLFQFNLRQLDRSLGFFPMTIEIKDTNAVQAGDQTLTIQVENLADGVREILQLLCNDEKTGDAVLNVAMRTMFEAGVTHKLVAEMHYELNEIQEFLGYEGKEKTIKVPFAYNPLAVGLNAADSGDEERLESVLPRILDQKKVSLKVMENTDRQTLMGRLAEILRQAQIAAAGVSERVNDKDSLLRLLSAADLGMDIANAIQLRQLRRAINGMTDEQFERWTEEAELRFTQGRSPIPEDMNEPFQQPPEARVKIRTTELDPRRFDPPVPLDGD